MLDRIRDLRPRHRFKLGAAGLHRFTSNVASSDQNIEGNRLDAAFWTMTAQFEALKRRFLERCASDLAVLEEVQCAPEAVSRGDLKTLVHQMSGAAAIFGFPQLSAPATHLDNQLAAGTPPSREHVRALIHHLRHL